LFAFIMVLGTESVTAQSTISTTEINEKAASQTKASSKKLGINKDQRQQMYIAFQDFGKYKATYSNGSTDQEIISKAKKVLDNKIIEILTKEQYELYQQYISK